jgi:N-acetylglucosaminyl-diphospho-decaprenol L-rhamnosyltransferase
MRLGAVLVLYRAWPAAEKTVHALLSGTRPPDRVVVVDNASGDGSPEAIRALFPHVDVVEATANRGPAAAMNLGAERLLARGIDAVLLLTADCILAPGALAALEARLDEAPGVGVVGPLLARASAPHEVFSAGGFVDPRTWDVVHHREPPGIEEWEGGDPQAREWLDGACLLVRSDALCDVGPLDEEYFHYFDDVDHHVRMRSRGWGVECVPAAVACQEPGPIRPEVWVRNRFRFLDRHAPRAVLVREVARQARAATRDVIRGDSEQAAGRARGAALFLSRRWGPLPGP